MSRYTIHLVPNFHYDVEYLKTYSEYLPVCFDNLKEALKILRNNSEYTYLIEQVVLLDEFWKKFPEYRRQLKQFVQKGRIEIAPGMYCMPDMNIPNGESLFQQIYYGKKWTKEHLGIEPKSAWIADCFGHNLQIPQILTKCGYKYYFFMRGIPKIDQKTEFYWQGIDGTRIPTYWIIGSYGGIVKFTGNEKIDFTKIRQKINQTKTHAVSNQILIANGGDFLKPQSCAPEMVKKWNRSNKQYKIVFSTPDTFFSQVLNSKRNLSVVRKEFNPDRQGAYSSRIRCKQLNRYLENKISTAEKLSTIVSIQSGRLYPEQKIDGAWKLILINQFHDIICGTCIDQAFHNTLKRYKTAEQIIDGIITNSIKFFSQRAQITISIRNKRNKKNLLFVFNPLAIKRKEIVTAKFKKLNKKSKYFEIVNSQNKKISTQIVKKDNNCSTIVFLAGVPSLGYKFFKIEEKNRKPKVNSNFSIEKNKIETKFYKIGLTDAGVISSLVSKENGFEYVSPQKPFFNTLVMQDDNGDLWQYYQGPLSDGGKLPGYEADPVYDPMPEKEKLSVTGRRLIGFFAHSKDNHNSVKIVEKGPVRITIKVEGELAFWKIVVKFCQYIYIYPDLKRIDFKTEILPTGKHYRLRVCFPANIKNCTLTPSRAYPERHLRSSTGTGKIRHEIPFGVIERQEGEYPAQNWIDYSDNKKGLLLINQGLPGNNVTDGVMMISLFRSAAMEYKGPSKLAFEEGVKHTFYYSVVPYVKGEEFYPSQEGMVVNNPLIIKEIISNDNNMNLPKELEYVSIEPDNIILSAMRLVRKNKVLLRVYESQGKKTTGMIKFFTEIKQYKNNIIRFNTNPYEIKTLLIELVK